MLLPVLLLTLAQYTRDGNPQDIITKPQPGYLLMGGGKDVEKAFEWLIAKSNGGDFLVLRASGTPAYNPFVQKLGKVNSVATLILKQREQSSDPDIVDKVLKAEAIFLGGGDQWNYIRLWKDTPLSKALQQRIDAGVPIGGTSAGLAVLGEHYFSAEHDTITSDQALADAFHEKATLGTGFLRIKPLRGIITDSHFTPRKRIGRLASWLSRLKKTKGIGIDEATALLVEPNGTSRVVGRNLVWFLKPTRKPASTKPVTLNGIEVQTIAPGQTFNLRSWTSTDAKRSTLNIENGAIQIP
ncbi:MAG: cyanophycinase [Acidobacteria bacterium]|nr:cyanophycinase [Acidobacteriota bacterium]